LITLVPELHLTAAVADLARVYPWLDQVAADVAPDLLTRMHVVLEEAVANAALHGFPDGRSGRITVRARHLPAEVILEIEDNGIPFDPTAAAPRPHAKTLDDVEPGGWGLGLIRAYCQTIAYRREDERNRLSLHFARGPVP
jgi:anti-sigma regulatory factor (Ser/Thr protein kinase)